MLDKIYIILYISNMSEIRISSTKFTRSVGEVLGRIRYRGETFVIEKNGKPVAILSPYSTPDTHTVRNALKAWVEAAKPDRDFADTLERVGQEDSFPGNPWESS